MRLFPDRLVSLGAPLIITGLMTLPTAAEDLEFDPRTVIPRAFPAIVTPKTVSVSEAEADNWVRDDELVIGVVVGDSARAYPVNTLTGPKREIINDELGGRSIAATW